MSIELIGLDLRPQQHAALKAISTARRVTLTQVVTDALEAWRADGYRAGWVKPHQYAARGQGARQRFDLRMPKWMREIVDDIADRHDVSEAALLRQVIDRYGLGG